MTFQTFTAREYLKIDIANSYGLDKLSWDDRIAWFDANENQLDGLLTSADEPALFYAGVKAWRDVLAGKPIGYMISLDATSSGLQLLAALTGDRSAAQLCNVVDTGKREDAYTGIYEAMLSVIGDEAKITREDTKRAIMTALYSSKAVPKEVFGEGELLRIFYEVLKSLVPASWQLNEAMTAFWNPDAYSHDWVLPDNFHVKTKVMNQVREVVHFLNEPFDVFYNVNAPTPEGRSLGANTIHSIDGMIVREMTRRCDYDPRRIQEVRDLINRPITFIGEPKSMDDHLVIKLWQHYLDSGYLSARILDHLRSSNVAHVDVDMIQNLIDSLPNKPFKLVSIHDCFRCLPHYANDLRRQYNLQLQLIAKSKLLQFIIRQLLDDTIVVNPLDSQLWKDIPNTNYALS